MMEKFEKPELEVILFETEDIIVSSNYSTEFTNENG